MNINHDKLASSTLVDPGYLDPANRDATIVVQGVEATGCTDILRREDLKLAGRTVHVQVPMGTIRIVDIAHR